MAARDDAHGSKADVAPSAARGRQEDGERLSIDVMDDLAISVDAALEDDAAGEEPPSATAPGISSSGEAVEAADIDPDDEEPPDAPLGLTSVHLPARGRRRGRPGTIF
jgi:hypothetical protein